MLDIVGHQWPCLSRQCPSSRYEFMNIDNIKNVYESKVVILKEDGIMTPPMLYKIIKCNTEDAQYASGFIFHNAKSEKNQDN